MSSVNQQNIHKRKTEQELKEGKKELQISSQRSKRKRRSTWKPKLRKKQVPVLPKADDRLKQRQVWNLG